ncbi:MAG TPA: hypothetical protein VHE35_23760, partial [Kofleriaceae bacterium]|nr:hypothetical protein [Kofleriaceae bacterium]
MRCPSCNAVNAPASKFCGGCGTRLAPGPPTVPPAASTVPPVAPVAPVAGKRDASPSAATSVMSSVPPRARRPPKATAPEA